MNTIAEASRRIADLIAAVASYSNMDRAAATGEVDVHAGIRTTLTMLAPKLREKAMKVKSALTLVLVAPVSRFGFRRTASSPARNPPDRGV